MVTRLEFQLMDGKTIKAETDKDCFTVGRSSKCDVVVPHEGLSRMHCSVIIENGEIYLTDLGSANGVLINEKKISPDVKTIYNPLFTLFFGTIEVSRIAIGEIETDTEAVLDHEIAVSGPHVKVPLRRTDRSIQSGAKLHPGLRGFFLLSALTACYLFYSFVIQEDDISHNDISRMQHELKMKNKSNDGSVKTRNF